MTVVWAPYVRFHPLAMGVFLTGLPAGHSIYRILGRGELLAAAGLVAEGAEDINAIGVAARA